MSEWYSKAESRRQALESLDDEPERHPDGLIWMIVLLCIAIGYVGFFRDMT